MRTLPILILGTSLALAGCAAAPVEPTDGGAGPGAASGSLAQPAGLTRDEVVIWNSLTDEAKRSASAFIANGGTLTQFVNT